MNRKQFIKSVAVMAGATALSPSTASASIFQEKPIKKPSSTRKYVCQCCGNSVRATKDVNIICADCNEQMTTE